MRSMMNGVSKVDEVRYGQKDVPGVNPPPARSDPLPPRLVSRHEQCADRLDRLRRQVLAVAEDLERYASDPEGLPMSERKLAWTLRQIVAGERPEACRCGKPAGHCSHCHDDLPAQTVADALDDAVGHLRDMLLRALATTAPETAPTATQTGEQAQVRGESHTEPAGTVDDALHRIALHRIADHLGIPQPWISPAETAWRVIAEIDRLRADDLAIRRILRDYGASVGGTDPLPAIVAETLDAARKTGAELVELRDRHEQVCEELAEAREALVAAQTEGDEAWDRLSNLVDELAGALEMPGTPDDHEIIREARAFGQLRVELAALRAGVLDLADRVTAHAKGYGEPLEDVAADFAGIAEELHTLTAGSAPDTGSTP